VDFREPPDFMMVSGEEGMVANKTVPVPRELNMWLVWFQGRHPKQAYKFLNGTLALWRALLREEWRMIQEAKAERRRTGQPVAPKRGPIMQAMEDEIGRMKAEV
jgi:hypothetical protein